LAGTIPSHLRAYDENTKKLLAAIAPDSFVILSDLSGKCFPP
jgi:hypothetical protein